MVDHLADRERCLSRACANTPVASRMPTPLGSLRAAAEIIRVRHEIVRLASQEGSPYLPISPVAMPIGLGNSGQPPPGGTRFAYASPEVLPSGTASSSRAGAGAHGHWPKPTAEDLEEDERTRPVPPGEAANGDTSRPAKRGRLHTPAPARGAGRASRWNEARLPAVVQRLYGKKGKGPA